MVCVQKFHDFLLDFLPAIALKGPRIYAGGVLLAQTRSELSFAMDRIIMRDEPADEPDNDGRRFCGSLVRRDTVRENDLARGKNGLKEGITNANRRIHPAEYIRA